MPRKLKSLEEKFWPKVNKDPNHPKGCWEWMGKKAYNGRNNKYIRGVIRVNNKFIKVHRISYNLHYGEIPPGLEVCHKCDNPLCVNPDHLELGTHQKNMEDCVHRGRLIVPHLSGEDHPGVKLTQDQVNEIKISNITQVELAKKYGVSQTRVSRIKRGKTWRVSNEAKN